jgi:hypothetical protein
MLRRYLIDLLLDLFLGLPRQADEVKVVIFTSCQFFEPGHLADHAVRPKQRLIVTR